MAAKRLAMFRSSDVMTVEAGRPLSSHALFVDELLERG